jgi:DNA-binding LacI/PurR family transcriptional regulator
MQTRVTLRDVAAKAGVHHTTASRALKDDPRVQAETLAKIRAIAKEMGYMPDPMLSSLNAYRHASRPSQYHGTVAWITNFPSRDGWRGSTCYSLYFQGASEQLTRHGYQLEEFWLREPNLTGRRASQVLNHRGIRGLLICPLSISRGHLSLQWEKFSAVTFGYSLVRPRLHLFSAAHYRAMISGMRKLRALGYRRIGLVTSDDMNERMDRMWTAAYSSELPKTIRGRAVPICLLGTRAGNSQAANSGYKQQVLKWFRTHKPDAIITPTIPVVEWLTEEGYEVPKDVAVACMSLHYEGITTGIVEASREIGCAAANFLIGMLQRGEYGIPSLPQRVLVEGTWYTAKPAVGKQRQAVVAAPQC